MRSLSLILFALLTVILLSTPVLGQDEPNQSYGNLLGSYSNLSKFKAGDIITVNETQVVEVCDFEQGIISLTQSGAYVRIACSYVGYKRTKK